MIPLYTPYNENFYNITSDTTGPKAAVTMASPVVATRGRSARLPWQAPQWRQANPLAVHTRVDHRTNADPR